MGENKEYMTHTEELGCIHISEDVLATIASGAAAEVDGITGLMNLTGKKTHAKGVRISLSENTAVIALFVMIRYGCSIPETAEKIQTGVASAIESMTGFSVKAVNVHVGGISFQ